MRKNRCGVLELNQLNGMRHNADARDAPVAAVRIVFNGFRGMP
jgi:hypothetical protein